MVQFISARHGSETGWLRVIVIMVLVLSLLSVGWYLSPTRALAYGCNSPHCYGEWIWSPAYGSPINGGNGYIQVSSMNCYPCTDGFGQENGFIDNEMWVTQPYNTNCRKSKNACWVEAGYATYSNISSGTTVNYYWADNRPDSSGGNYNEHVLSYVPAADYGNSTWFDIHRTSGNSFLVTISSGSIYATYSSTYNSMVPSEVHMGQELYGSGGASAASALYTDRWYWDTNGNQWPLPTSEGYSYVSYPPFLLTTGGDFYTYCC